MAQAEGKATARERQSQVERLHILDDDEWDALYGRPRFTSAEQAEYFSLSGVERAALDEFHSFKSKLCLVLQLGYFKARRLFFRFDLPEVEADASFIRDRYFPDFRLLDVTVTKVTRLRQQRLILELCGYHRCLPHERRQLETKARQTARVWSQPVYLLRELLATLAEQRIMTLGYRFLQDTVSQALAFEQDRLITLTRNALTPSDREALQQLLADAPGLYELTQLKREPRDFSVGEIKREIQRGIQLRPLFRVAQGLLPGLGISSESVKYYASLVGYYSVHRLKQLNEWLVAVYLLCFVHHRYQRLNDHLIQSLIHKVRRYGEEAKAAAKEKVYAAQVENHHNLHQAGRVLKLFTDDTIAGTTPFAEVRASAFTILERPKLDLVADHITAQARLDETAFQWEELDRLAAQFKLHLRPILENVELSAISAQAPLLRAIDFLKTALGKNRSLGQTGSPAFPLRFISETMKRYLFTTDLAGRKQVLPNRYEFLVYRSVRHGLEAGDIFCRDSVRFRSFEDDLVTDHQWQEKDRLLADAGLTSLTQPIREHLQALEQQLESRLTEVNRRIANGENEHFQVTRRGPHPHWTLRYPRHAETVNHAFFDRLAQVEIGNLLQFINQQCPFLDVFDHVLGRYTKQAADSSLLLAALIAWATNLGPGRMSEISDLDAHRLITTSDNFIRLETLRAANDRLSQALAQLPVFTHYHLGDRLHSSSDGQKFETRSDTFNARHSPKYFGLKKGVVASTLVAN
ncbi:MAG TPA: Tn3 family transposase, partial [Acidobacteriota bacterium]|nr:Tn3 family transposase [Acidobacteriota bacterium]